MNIAKDKDPIKNIFFFPYTSATLPHTRKRQPYKFIDAESLRSLRRIKMSSLTELRGHTDIIH